MLRPGLGTRVRERTKPARGKEFEQIVEFTEFQRPQRLHVHIVEGLDRSTGPGLSKCVDGDRTRLHFVAEGSLRGLLWLVSPLAKLTISRQFAAYHQRLRDNLELLARTPGDSSSPPHCSGATSASVCERSTGDRRGRRPSTGSSPNSNSVGSIRIRAPWRASRRSACARTSSTRTSTLCVASPSRGGRRSPRTSPMITAPSPNPHLRAVVLADLHALLEAERRAQPAHRLADVVVDQHRDDRGLRNRAVGSHRASA